MNWKFKSIVYYYFIGWSDLWHCKALVADRFFCIVTYIRSEMDYKKKIIKCRAGTWFYASVVGWMLRYGRGTQK